MRTVTDLTDILMVRHPYSRRRRRTRTISEILVHRFGPSIEGRWVRGAVDLADEFAKVAELRAEFSGGRVYDLVVTSEGAVEQWIPLSEYGAHALDLSATTVGIAVLGDFRREAPTEPQWSALVWCVGMLRGAYQCGVTGHGNRPAGTRDREKLVGGVRWCPGELLDVDRLAHVTDPARMMATPDLGARGFRA